MPRYTLRRPAESLAAPSVPDELRRDERVRLIGELPRMLLIESEAEVANEWAARMEGWILTPEQRAKIPDARPKLKRRAG